MVPDPLIVVGSGSFPNLSNVLTVLKNGNTGTITDVSDIRLKDRFLPIPKAIRKLLQIKGYSYHMKEDPDGSREYGVIAQEVEKVFPEMVKVVDPENGYLGVSYIQLVPVLVEAVRGLDAENQELKSALAEIYLRLEKLEKE